MGKKKTKAQRTSSAGQAMAISPNPPVWLDKVCHEHRPLPRLNDMICAATECNEGGVTLWTPEHISRMIHEAMASGILNLFKRQESAARFNGGSVGGFGVSE